MKPALLRSSRTAYGRLICVAIIAWPRLAQAQNSELDALELADQTAQRKIAPHPLHVFLESAAGIQQNRSTTPETTLRAGLDAVYSAALTPLAHLYASARLDASRPAASGAAPSIFTWRETYLNVPLERGFWLDAGRINVYQGNALAYNPTDQFSSSSLRANLYGDPESRKKNRQGSIMLRSTYVAEWGSFSALFSPRLNQPDTDLSSPPDWRASNPAARWQLALSPMLQLETGRWQPQLLLFGTHGNPVQFGLNTSVLFDAARVGYLEWSIGHSTDALHAFMPHGEHEATPLRQRVVFGLRSTFANKLTLTLEAQHHDTGLGDTPWNETPARLGLSTYVQWRSALERAQQPGTRNYALLYANWPDAVWPHLELSALLEHARTDASQVRWLEARYHFWQSDLAMQWQSQRGGPTSVLGAAPVTRIWQLVWRQYF